MIQNQTKTKIQTTKFRSKVFQDNALDLLFDLDNKNEPLPRKMQLLTILHCHKV